MNDSVSSEFGNLIIEKMVLEDLPQVLAIEQLSFPRPLSEELFRTELGLSVAHLYVARHKNDAGHQNRIVGYVDFWKVLSEVHIITFAIHPDERRKNVGSTLLQYLTDKAWRDGAEEIFLDVRPSNISACSLYRKFGFVEYGRRKHYYPDNDEEALMMRLRKK